jgi:AraC family transcriptional regulator
LRKRTAAGSAGICLERVHRALDHVRAHLAEPLPLERVARAAGVSPFHFHRLFKALMGETLHQFVLRARLERALVLMAHAPRRSLTQIALACGFASSSDFTRAFKQRHGVAPSRFDLARHRDARRGELVEATHAAGARGELARLPAGENPDGFQVRLRELPARTLAYLRVHDPYRGGVPEAVARLLAWAQAHGCADRAWYGYQWEDPEVTALEDCRYDIAVEVDELRPQGEIGRMRFPPMLVAEVEIEGDVALELRALDWLFGTWLPRSGRLPADLPCFEAFRGRPFELGTERFALAVHLPLQA